MKTKPSGCLSVLRGELRTLRVLDDRNQQQFSSAQGGLTKAQMHLLTEGVFFAAFRAYEQFMRNVFLLYCCGIQPSGRKLVQSFLRPKTLPHAEALVKSAMPFLDWSSPDTVVERATAYLKDGYPMKSVVTANMDILRTLKKIRNHIAHMSSESGMEFKKVLKAHYGTIPLSNPRPGQYLLLPCKGKPQPYYLRLYIDTIEDVGTKLT